MLFLFEREDLSPHGVIEYVIYRHGKPIEGVKAENLVVDGGRNMLAKLISGAPDAEPVKYIGFGTGTKFEEPEDSTLENLLLIEFDNVYIHDGANVVFEWTLGTDRGNGMDITEFGLFTASGVMITHQVRGKIIAKDDDMMLKGRYYLHF